MRVRPARRIVAKQTGLALGIERLESRHALTGAVSDPVVAAMVDAAQYEVNHTPRLQLGDAALVGYDGASLDRVEVLWQTIPAGDGTTDTFTVDYRATGGDWQAATLDTPIETGIEGRLVWSAAIMGLAWNAPYEYRVQHHRSGTMLTEYSSGFRTRLAAGDATPFSFAAYGDSAAGPSAAFRAVQARISDSDAAFAVLLGDNAYASGSHAEYDSRFDPDINPEATAWTASHIDYVAFGNHDVATAAGLPTEQNYATPVPVAGVTSSVALPASERAEHNYSWDHGCVHFTTFDSNALRDPERLDGLLDWVVGDLAASHATWKIVVAHHPVAGVPDKPESAADGYYQQVVSRLKAAGADLLMTGHSHTYARTYPLTGQIDGVATFVDQSDVERFVSGQGLIQLVSGAGGVEIRDGSFTRFPFVAAGFSGSTSTVARPGFSHVEVSAERLLVSYVAADDGSVIDRFSIEKQPTVTASFPRTVGRFIGTVDTSLQESAASTSFVAATSFKVDGDNPNGTQQAAQGLLRFRNLFGPQRGRIPLRATIVSATLQCEVTNGGSSIDLHRMLVPWSARATWVSRGDGIQADGREASAFADASTGVVRVGTLTLDVSASVRQWQARPRRNYGWALLPTGPDGVDILSAQSDTPPRLTVTYTTATSRAVSPAMFGILDVASSQASPRRGRGFLLDHGGRWAAAGNH